MANTNIFQNILIWALPASGKSEIMAFLRGLTPGKRDGLHIGNLVEIDDYPRVASFFEIDDEREANGKPRLFTRTQTYDEGGILDPGTWDDLDQHLNFQYKKALAKNPNLHEISTVLLECARGGPQNAEFPLPHGYQQTLRNLRPEILEHAAILYVKVTPEESRKKNDARYDPKDPHGILAHRVPTSVMLNDYGCDDVEWMINQSSSNHFGYVQTPSKLLVPIVVFDNQDDKTSFVREKGLSEQARKEKSELLYDALENALHSLFQKYRFVSDTSHQY